MKPNRFNFRVLDRENKCFSTGLLLTRKGVLKEVDFETGTITTVDQINYEIMQSTGMVDKNGKEIFEGDIIKSDFLGIGIIKYSENLKRFTVINPNYADEEDYCSDMTWDDFVEEFNKNQYEVVGNIYENPELLEEFRKKLKEFEKKLEIFMKNLNF